MVLHQGIFTTLLVAYISVCLVISQHVAAAETVNCLFRITDHNHATGLHPVGITPDLGQQIILILIGVLKFIDQNQRITCLHKLGKTLSLLALQCFCQCTDLLGKSGFTLLLQGLRQTGLHALNNMKFQIGRKLLQLLIQILFDLAQRINCHDQTMLQNQLLLCIRTAFVKDLSGRLEIGFLTTQMAQIKYNRLQFSIKETHCSLSFQGSTPGHKVFTNFG